MSHHRMLLVALAITCGLGATARGEEKITTRIGGLPAECVEGEPLTITVEYRVAPELGEVPLRVELKNPRHIVLDGRSAWVSGTGSKTFTFTVPGRDQEKELLFAVWYGQVWTEALVPIINTETVAILSREEADTMEAQREVAERRRQELSAVVPAGGAAAVLIDDLPGLDRDLASRVLEALRARGLTALSVTTEELCNPFLLVPELFHTLVLTNSPVYPQAGVRTLERYLARGGDLVALNAPALTTAVSWLNGRWMDAKAVRAELAQQKPERILADFESGQADDWGYTSSGGPPAQWEFAPEGAAGTAHSLHCTIPDYQGWNTFVAPAIERPFGPGQELTCLWAKGGPRTTSLQVEWQEQDGSRWIAVIPLTTEWQYYALTPAEFAYWQDNPSKGRGGTGDRFRPENARQVTVGIAMTHTRMDTGRHEFWVDEIGVASNPYGLLVGPEELNVSAIEPITPAYKVHRVSNAVSLRVSDKQSLLAAAELPVPAGLMSVQPRPQGTGYNKERRWRWIPLLEAYDAQGEVCGTPACLFINRVGRFKDAVIAAFTLPPTAYDERLVGMIADVAARMHHGFFLFEGGSEFFAYFQGESVTLGARTINLGTQPDPPCQVQFLVTSDIGTEFSQTVPVTAGQAECRWTPGQFAKRTYQVTCTLVDGAGHTLDMLTHPLVVWLPPSTPQFMQVRNGRFFLHGKPWYAHGVNYMPSSGIGIEEGEYFEFWMDRQPYDPVVIERDLRRIKAAGMNTVSIFCYYRSLGSRNLLDILERCRRLGLMVNLSLRPGTPLDFRWEEMKALIEAYRLRDNDTVFAYDLAWEPAWGGHASLKRWDAEWEKWILERYGSVASAEQDWGVPAPREDDVITGPSDEQMTTEGPHRVMVCAYRRFLDDLLARYYGRANRLVKSIDPNHFTSFRMSSAGDPLARAPWMGYDFRGLARSVDIMEPEGYGRQGDWNNIRIGRFTVDYARCMAPGRPVMWAEFGLSPYGKEAWDITPERLISVGRFYDLFFQMVRDSQADGAICWWYPGGFRYGENSDYGIINPDGSWRPVTQAIRNWADRLTPPPRELRPVDVWLPVDRDATARGICGVYDAIKHRYWSLIAEGKNPGLRTDGYGLTSVTAPRVAVGNVPYRPGANPHKFLNAEFDRLEMRDATGRWQPLTDGCTVKAARGQPLLVRATIGNTGEATWVAGERDGCVSLSAGEASVPLRQDVPFMGTARVERFQVCELQGDMDLCIQMLAWPDVTFGEKVRVHVVAE